jgi:hypothetical protein
MQHARKNASLNLDYLRYRAGLLHAGHTLASFARTFGYRPQTVYSAAKGRRHGIQAIRIRKHIETLL